MATKRTPAKLPRPHEPEPPGEPPTSQELEAALADFAMTYAMLQDARKEHDAAREVVVALLRRCGLTGLVL